MIPLSRRERPRTRAVLALAGLIAAISAFAKDPPLVADPAAPLAEAWTHQSFVAATEYRGIVLDGVAAIRAVGRNSASGLYRNFRYRIAEHPDIVVRSGEERLGRWLRERRNVMDDFRRAFGREPPEAVEVVAVFTDNDQTREAVEADYGAVRALPR